MFVLSAILSVVSVFYEFPQNAWRIPESYFYLLSPSIESSISRETFCGFFFRWHDVTSLSSRAARRLRATDNSQGNEVNTEPWKVSKTPAFHCVLSANSLVLIFPEGFSNVGDVSFSGFRGPKALCWFWLVCCWSEKPICSGRFTEEIKPLCFIGI